LSNKFSRTPAALVLDILPSRQLRNFYLGLTLLAVFAIASSSLSLSQQIILALVVLIYAVLLLRRPRPSRLRFNAGWYLKAGDQAQGDEEFVLQLQRATVWPMLIVLQFRDPRYSRLSVSSSYSVVLLRDHLNADDWRHLRIYLRHYNVYGDMSSADIN